MRSLVPLFLSLFLLTFVGLPSRAIGQEQEGAEEDSTQLPEIAPREIEIRGQLQIAFPRLDRQPLDGFSSDPPLPSVPESHRPYAETYKQELQDLPESLPELETTTQSLEGAETSPARGFLETGTGRYFSRFAEGRLSVPLSSSETFTVHGDYSGTEGFTAFDSPSIKTPSDEALASLSFESRREILLFDASLTGSAQQYNLYGATPAPGTQVQIAPDREAHSLGGSFRLRTRGPLEASLQGAYDYTQYATHFLAPDQGDADVFAESRFDVQGAMSIPLGSLSPRLDGDVAHARYDGDVPGGTALHLDVGGAVPLLDTDPFFVRAGARFLSFEAPADPTLQSSPPAEATFVVPSVRVQWAPTRSTTLHLQNTPLLRNSSLETFYSENPYAEHAPSLRPTLETTNAEAGLTFSKGVFRISTTAGYRYAPSFQYFEPGGDARYRNGIFQASYESARIIHGGARLVLEGSDNFHTSWSVSIRDGELVESGSVIPNFSALTADAMVSYSFSNDQGLLQLNGRYERGRYPTTARQNALDPYFAVDLEGSYSVTSTFDVVAHAKNLSVSSPILWARYPRPPAMLSAGVRIHW